VNTKRICSNCQQPVEVSAPHGLCPECLLKAGLGTGVALGPDSQTEGRRASFVAPTVEEMARLFPQCDILGLIGQGGMGAVYKARQKTLDRVVALKILPPGIGKDPAFAERFTREAKALARLNHPGVVTLYEFGQADGPFFFLMEFVDGMSLRHLLEVERISAREALAIVPQICDALQYAHDQGIVHRDIKPENVLLDRQGRVKVADFGLAKLMETQGEATPGTTVSSSAVSPLTEAGKVMGTPQYMAPEQRDHPTEVDHRADIYSLGVVFYQMLTGELPGQRIEPPSQKVQIDVRLDEVVLRALEKQPGRRYQHASEVKSAVATIAATRPPAADVPSLAEARGRVQAPGFGLCFIGAANTLFAVGLLLWLTLGAWAASQRPAAFELSDLKSTFLKLGFVTVPLLLLALVLGVLVVAGGLYMRRLQQYRLAVAASILAVFSPLGVLGLPISIWCLVVLMDPKVREAFAATRRGKADRRPEITPSLDPSPASRSRQESWKTHMAVVGVRKGKRVVHWPGVALSSSLMAFLFLAGALLPHFVSGHSIPPPFAFAMMVVLIFVTMSLAVYVGLRKRPIERLVRLEEGLPRQRGVAGKTTNGSGSRLSRTAVAGLVMAALSFLLPGLLYLLMQPSIPDAAAVRPLLWPSVILGGLLACATTIVGAVGVTQIRRSAGRLCGLGLAVFDGLFFPLLALDALILWTSFGVARLASFMVIPWLDSHDLAFRYAPGVETWTLLTLVFIAWVDFLVIRHLWRAVNRSLANAARDFGKTSASAAAGPRATSGGTEEERSGEHRKIAIWALIGAAALCAMGLGLFVWIQRPERLDTTIAADSPDGQYSALASTWRAMRMFGEDSLTYRFTVSGRSGALGEKWEVPVPIAELTDGFQTQGLGYFSFAKHGRIQWSDDGTRVSFRVRGVEVSARDLSNGRHSSQAGFFPEHEVELTANGSLQGCFLDLDTGQVLSASKEFAESLRASGRLAGGVVQVTVIREWMRSNRVDIVKRSSEKGVMLVDGFAVMLAEQTFGRRVFDSVSVGQILKAVQQKSGAAADPIWAFAPQCVFAFQTRKGTIGLLEALEIASPGRTRLRFKCVRDSVAIPLGQAAEAALSHKPGVQASAGGNVLEPRAGFGEIVEVEVRPSERGTNGFLDLDTGKLLDAPADLADRIAKGTVKFGPGELHEWMRSSGADVACLATSPPELILIGGAAGLAGMLRNPDDGSVVAKHIDQVTAKEAVGLAREIRPAVMMINPQRQWSIEPVTANWFQTREGGIGVLEITGYSRNPSAVKMRYRLVEDANVRTTGL